MNGVIVSATSIALVAALVACHKEPVATASDAGAVKPVPAPNSLLARELGADDAGRGTYSFTDDGPACGTLTRLDRDAGLGALNAGMQFFETAGAPPKGPDEDKRSPIELDIRTPPGVLVGGRFYVTTTLTNHDKAPFLYQRAMDGTDFRWVSPFVDVYLRAEATKKTYRWAHGNGTARCGNTNPRVADDFITLKPGEERAKPFGQFAEEMFTLEIDAPGTYTLWAVYTSCTDASFRRRDPEDAPIPANTFEGAIASNGVRLTLNAPR